MITGLAVLATALAIAVGYGNGANDISKTIATLVGSGESNYRRAAAVGTIASVAGAFSAAPLAFQMVKTFSHGLLSPNTSPSPTLSLSILIGASTWLFVATRTGMPVSTTHSLTGALAFGAAFAFGPSNVLWPALSKKILMPLLLSPAVSLLITFPLFQVVDRGAGFCPERCLDRLHWLSGVSASFARSFNDVPKIVGVLLAFFLACGDPPSSWWMFVLIGAGAAVGAYVSGARVTRTLAYGVTEMNHHGGLAANMVTSLLVIGTAVRGVPVSTTHVSSCAIMGVGLCEGVKAVNWKTVRDMALAWLVTFPASGAVSIAAYLVLHRIIGSA